MLIKIYFYFPSPRCRINKLPLLATKNSFRTSLTERFACDISEVRRRSAEMTLKFLSFQVSRIFRVKSFLQSKQDRAQETCANHRKFHWKLNGVVKRARPRTRANQPSHERRLYNDEIRCVEHGAGVLPSKVFLLSENSK